MGTDFGSAKIRLREKRNAVERRRDPVPNFCEVAKTSGLDCFAKRSQRRKFAKRIFVKCRN